MKTRIISAAVATVIAVIVLALHNTFVFNLAIGLISVISIMEIFKATEYVKYKNQAIICYAYAFINAFIGVFHRNGFLNFFNDRLYSVLFVLAMCLSYLKMYEKFKYTDLFFMTGVSVLVSYSYGTLINMSMQSSGVFMILVTLCAAWLADSGAYFAGTFLGKTKLCPNISPKKTVEGLIGGVISNGIILLILGFFYNIFNKEITISYIMLFISGMIAALIGLVGDLTASEIKRQCGIKDYGNLMPGHGGAMDRFDSVLLVAPFMYYLFMQGFIIK